jgi:hypothetical protein
MRIDELYKELFKAEEEGNQEKVEELREKIKNVLAEGKKDDEPGVCQMCGTERDWDKDGEPCRVCSHDHIVYKSEFKENNNIELDELDIKEFKKEYLDRLNEKDKAKIEFFYKTRKKAFHKNLRESLFSIDGVDDVDLALAMTSMLTHSLIEMKKEGSEIYKKMDIYTLTETVSKFLSGDLSSEEVIKTLKEHYGNHLTTKVITEKGD